MNSGATVPQIFSRQRRAARWRRAVVRQASPNAADFVFEAFADEIQDRLGFVQHEAARALVVGDPSGLCVRMLERSIDTVQRADPTILDEESALDGTFDLIVSLGSADTINDVPGALLHLRHALSPDGLAMIGFVGAGSLEKLRGAMLAAEPERAAPRMHPMIDTRAAAALMQRAGFRRQVVDSFPLKVRYASLDRLIGDLRDQGLTNVLVDAPPLLSRTALDRARAAFLSDAAKDGKVTETFELIVMTGWGS